MAELIKAARKEDLITHDASQLLRILGAVGTEVAFIWRGTQIVRAVLFFTTPAGIGLFVASIVIEYAVGQIVDIAADQLGQAMTGSPIPAIDKGSNNVGINRKPAARGGPHDPTRCHNDKVKHGSKWVSFNQKPAARVGDTTESCSGKIATGSDDVFIGGPLATRSERSHALQDVVKYAFIGINLGNEARNGLSSFFEEVGKTTGDAALDKLWSSVFE
ncbi:MAG: hypothetical protein HOW73_41740 [Polyangiaceae bacterium]|nr:hypothetical protein [Polyangiaceae bacterium]